MKLQPREMGAFSRWAFKDQVNRARGDAALTTRVIADLVSGMTERQAIEMYRRLTGIELGSVFDSLL